jgi:hypothetical protein
MRTLRSLVGQFDNLPDAREFLKLGGDAASKEGWMVRTKADLRSKKEKADAGDLT